ncbi:GPC6A protein, partial [Amia calva]|nr:GPC6A protein [Amia calva]
MLAMKHAIEVINNSSLLNGLMLGYEIYDSCSDVSTAIRATMAFLNYPGSCAQEHYNTSEPPVRVQAVVGEAYSEISIAVAHLLNLELIPQISYGSTAEILSDKMRFPAFLRTVPNDYHQTKAMVNLIQNNGWNWIGFITTDGDYGRSAIESFVSQASELGICVAFKVFLPNFLSDKNTDTKINQAINTIRKNQRVNVIVSFAKPAHMMKIFDSFCEETLGKIWIASDSWSMSKEVIHKSKLTNIGKIIGFTFKTGNITQFQNYLNSLKISEDTFKENIFLDHDQADVVFLNDTTNINNTQESGVNVLINNLHRDAVYSVQIAISAIANAVVYLCKEINCKEPANIHPYELLSALKKTEFENDGKSLRFDSNGDINLGYNVVVWKSFNGDIDVDNTVSEYDINNETFIFSSNADKKELDLRSVISKCSDSCKPGQYKETSEGQHTCCYQCKDCAEAQYSNEMDMDECLSCNTSTEWSPQGSSNCTTKQLDYFRWNNGFAMVLLGIAALGTLAVLVIAIIFIKQRQTPVVKASGGPISYMILLSLLSSFISSVFFVGHPFSLKCKVRQVLFGLSFACCVSCILVKSLQIILAFQFKPDLKNALKKINKPYVIIACCVGIQGLICTLWLILKSPEEERIVLETTILVNCNEGSYIFFGVMLGYIALLAFVCFVCAFMGRKLPENYNEAKFITFGMLLYFISWIIFIPVYVSMFGKYLPAVEMVVILISNYGILCCHFFPKCYIILFKKQNNTKDVFRQKLFEYSSKMMRSKTAIRTSSINSLAVSTCSTTTPFCLVSDIKCVECFGNFDKFTKSQYTGTAIRRKRISSI